MNSKKDNSTNNERRLFYKKLPNCFYQGLVNTINHDGIEHSGYMAFLSMLALFPFLLLLVTLAGFLGNLEIGSKFIDFLLVSLPRDLISALSPRISEIVSGPPQGLITISVLGMIWTASSAVEGARTALNRAYHVSTPPSYIWRRMLSIVQFLIITMAVLISMLFLVLAPIFVDRLEALIFGPNFIDPVWTYVRYIASVVILFLSVATAYYTLPNVKQTLKSVVPGAIITVVLWSIGAITLSEYIKSFNQVNIVYGSLGGIIAALLFFYISSIIFIYGAEVNYLIEKALGTPIKVKVKPKKKAA